MGNLRNRNNSSVVDKGHKIWIYHRDVIEAFTYFLWG